jgi:hypothetical protein
MKISVVFASAIGLAFAESGIAMGLEEEKQRKIQPVVYNNSPQAISQPVKRIHRPKRSRIAYDSPSQGEALTVRHTHSSVRFHGLKRAFPYRISPPGVRLFIFSPRKKAWAAYLPNGKLVGYGRASGGAS